MTVSFFFNVIPLTPMESRPLKILTSSVLKRMAFPFAVVSSTSLSFLQICAPTSVVFSGNFIAIFPFAFTFVKSDNAFFRTLPVEVAKNI